MHDDGDAIRLKSKFFRGFADPTRLAILETLLDGEKNVNEIVAALGISQPNASGHLACLRDCGLVTSEGRGKYTYYRLYDEKICDLLATAESILAQVGKGIYACTRYEQARMRTQAHAQPLPSPNMGRRVRIETKNPK